MEIKIHQLTNTAKIKAYIPDGEVGYHFYKKRPGIILAPGGAYLIHATREREGVALEFLSRGYNVFILEYSLGFSSREAKESGLTELDTKSRYPLPVLEMMEAVHYIKTHGEELNLDVSRLFLMGFSAGGHLCASYSVFWNDPEITSRLSFSPSGNELRVTGIVLGYPLINPAPDVILELNAPENPDAKLVNEFIFQTQSPSEAQKNGANPAKHVTETALPAFVWHSIDDPIVCTADTTRFVLAMQEQNVPCEYHLFDHGGHGLCLANEIYARNKDEIVPDIGVWVGLAQSWMARQK